MTSNEKQYWFPAKRYGWGWGMPTMWQGWVVLGLFVSLVLAGVVTVRPTYGATAFAAYTGVLTLTLTAICWVKGEPPQWRWGKK
jgi:hypothetical protein